MDLEGKTALVTGASRGIGAAIAERLAAEGAQVMVNYAHSLDAANRVVEQIQADGGWATTAQANVARHEGVTTLFQQVDEIFGGRLTILVNNAGSLELGELTETTDKQFDETIHLNVRGVFLTAREAAKRMGQGGRIVNIGSIFGERIPFPGTGLYTMSKFAVAGFTRAWARDLGPKGITVNCVQPGPIETDLNPADSEFADQIRPLTALGRYGQPEEVAELVAYLISEKAAYVTGACLTIDGGINA